jgi:NADPH:quinone reductase-like Zn-dependent oxidoreductase
MKAYVMRKGSQSLDSLQQVQLDAPRPGPRQVLVRVHATSLNYRDQAVVTGQYFGGVVQRDTIPLSDGAGEIVEIGDEVTRCRVGDRVAGCFFQGWIDGRPDMRIVQALGAPADGMLAEYVVLDQDGVVPLPVGFSFEDGATLPCAALTAWNALMVNGHLTSGDCVLVMGTGGVSIFALQFAKAAGARVIITSSSDEKLERAKSMGADNLINYKKTPDWEQKVLELTGGLGVDNVIEVGGVGTLAKSFQTVGYRGQVSLIGVLAGREGDTNPHGLMLKAARLQGIFVGSRAMFEQMNRAIEVNALRPVIDKVFGFDEVKEAYPYQLAGKHFGKIVIAV